MEFPSNHHLLFTLEVRVCSVGTNTTHSGHVLSSNVQLYGWLPNTFHPCSANQNSSIFEAHDISLRDDGRILKAVLFGTPFFQFNFRTRIHLLLLAPGETNSVSSMTVLMGPTRACTSEINFLYSASIWPPFPSLS